jgi:hypothetical protein
MGLCLSIAHSTSTIGFGTSIQPVYLQHRVALAVEVGDGAVWANASRSRLSQLVVAGR